MSAHLSTDQINTFHEDGYLIVTGLFDAEEAGILHADYHTGNWFMNDADQAIAIDFGLSSVLATAGERHLTRAYQFILPALSTLGYDFLVNNLQSAWAEGLDAARQELLEVANEIA